MLSSDTRSVQTEHPGDQSVNSGPLRILSVSGTNDPRRHDPAFLITFTVGLERCQTFVLADGLLRFEAFQIATIKQLSVIPRIQTKNSQSPDDAYAAMMDVAIDESRGASL